jgi:tetratricopeptide (TPR) repeat protein
MTDKAGNSKRMVAAAIGLVAVLAIGALAYWRFVLSPAGNGEGEVVSEETVNLFYRSLAALDVEENELASRELKAGVQETPIEPALWANLAVAQMRLREMESAAQSLQQALELAPESRELAVLRAELLENSGAIEEAIAQLREVHGAWPENLAAAYSLSVLLGQMQSQEADEERLSLLSEILSTAPANLRARAEQARLAATLERAELLRESLDHLLRDAERWPDLAREQLAAADQAAASGDFRQAAISLTFFENVIKPRPEYQQSLAQLGVGSVAAVGTPLRTFLRLKLPAPEAAAADSALTFQMENPFKTTPRPDFVLAAEQAGEGRSTLLLSLSGESLQAGETLQAGESASLPFPGLSTEASPASIGVADLNSDFQQDLICVGAQGCRIYLQNEDGFVAHEASLEELQQPWRSVWTVDVDADGDLDLLLVGDDSPLTWIRNNGDMTFTSMPDFLAATKVRGLEAVDLDGDGDVDLTTLDASGEIAVWWNERGATYVAAPPTLAGRSVAIAVGDVDRKGRFDVLSLTSSGEIRRATWSDSGEWTESLLATWTPESLSQAAPGDVFLGVADIDNNGGVDLIASWRYAGIWLRGTNDDLAPLAEAPTLRVTSIADLNDDGLLDLVGMTEEGARGAVNQSKAGYGWHELRPLANTAAGDKRINSFGIGGRIEIRSGALTQAAAIDSPQVHFGLGRRKQAEVARIVWPNGVVQAEFDLQSKQSFEALQRLKGSCPWVFAFDGQEFRFLKDFIWRSPLGLRINAQATAGVIQTEDWIKVPGDRLAAVDGRYLLRITAELWETHFFDQIALLAVDHAEDVEIFVDERFVPNESPDRRVIVTAKPEPLQNLKDHCGRRLDESLAAIDGKYADGFELGTFQGVAEEHWVEFEFPSHVSSDRQVLIVGHGWIYPTDSSLNVAMAQGSAPRPFGLVLEQRNTAGEWRLVRDNLGFPAGKNKDVLIAVPGESLAASGRFRLRTNMEVYWDWLAWSCELADDAVQVTSLAPGVADLAPRGFSKVSPLNRRRPDVPSYEVESTQQRWLDLEGYYTRFGDVRELLAATDDRYVIMNAGDEIALEFSAPQVPPQGMRRDFVLIGDGWVKDGDFNTAFSRWVRPLPAHADVEYAGPLTPLEDDPVYRRFPDDWRDYHTRYVTPRQVLRGLWPQSANTQQEGRP